MGRRLRAAGRNPARTGRIPARQRVLHVFGGATHNAIVRATRSRNRQMEQKQFESFQDFYPFYLSEHADRTCRRLHFVGLVLVLLTAIGAVVTRTWWPLLLLPVIGYGFAWVGHYFFEKNRPATFTWPLYSFLGDWAMFRDILTGRIRF
jgi:hypothetical protein